MDFSFKNTKQPSKGVLLLADPFSKDENFTRSVVLLCDIDEQEAFGLVLNHPSNFSSEAVHEDLKCFQQMVGIGGPVDNESLFYIHQFPHVSGSLKINENLFFGGRLEEIMNHLNQHPEEHAKARLFVGYSGWSVEQLQGELAQNAWLVVDQYDSSVVMQSQSASLWKDIMVQQGEKFKLLADFTMFPEYN